MAVRRPKRPRPAVLPSKRSDSPSDDPPPLHSTTPLTPAGSRPTTIICEPWMARHRGSRALYLPATPPLLNLPGRQRFTQNIRSSSRRLRVEDGENSSHPPITADSPDNDPLVDDEPLFSDSLYMPDGPVDIQRPRLSGFQKKQNQWRRWSEEVIPSLITPYLAYMRRSVSLQCAPDLRSLSGDDSHCTGSCRPRSLAVNCVLFDREFCVLSNKVFHLDSL